MRKKQKNNFRKKFHVLLPKILLTNKISVFRFPIRNMKKIDFNRLHIIFVNFIFKTERVFKIKRGNRAVKTDFLVI